MVSTKNLPWKWILASLAGGVGIGGVAVAVAKSGEQLPPGGGGGSTNRVIPDFIMAFGINNGSFLDVHIGVQNLGSVSGPVEVTVTDNDDVALGTLTQTIAANSGNGGTFNFPSVAEAMPDMSILKAVARVGGVVADRVTFTV